MSRILVVVFSAAATAAAQVSVSSVVPANNARGVSSAAVVTLTFSAPGRRETRLCV
jgi:hypothetical protein